MSDSDKTKQELIAEIEALRAKLGDAPDAGSPDAATGSKGGLTRRDVLASAWVAPVILTVPLGAAVAPNRAQAQPPTGAPTTSPTVSPTSPTALPPTTSPTLAPTTAPTTAPSAVPTAAPTVAPTAFPTVAAGAIPVEISEFDIS